MTRAAGGSLAGPVTIAVIAKAPRPGLVKSRLCPPCTPEEAAQVAEALLVEVLSAAAAVPGARTAVLLDGPPGRWLPAGVGVIAQRGESLAERLANGFADLGGPTLVVAMDSPDVTVGDLAEGVHALRRGADAVLGPADDGGYWAIGLPTPEADVAARVFARVPMSVRGTLAAQRARLDELGMRWVELRALPDVDVYMDAVAAAARQPGGALARVIAGVERRLAAPSPRAAELVR